jgi:hypothetical protein
MDEIIENILEPPVQIALIMAIAEVIKNIGIEPRYIPIIDLVLGVIVGIFIYQEKYDLPKRIMIGLMLGLSACGTFSGFKNLMRG